MLPTAPSEPPPLRGMRLPVMTSASDLGSGLAAAVFVWVVSHPAASTVAAHKPRSNALFMFPVSLGGELRFPALSAAAGKRRAGLLFLAFLVALAADGLHQLRALARLAGEAASHHVFLPLAVLHI